MITLYEEKSFGGDMVRGTVAIDDKEENPYTVCHVIANSDYLDAVREQFKNELCASLLEEYASDFG